jgi:hypothetical protein
MMRKTTLVILAGFVILAAGLGLFADQNKVLDFKLVNKTEVTIEKIFISPADVNDWEEDVLDVNVLEAGETVEVKFSVDETKKLWDLKVEDHEGTAIIWENLDLSKVSVLTLKIVDGKPIAEIK